MPVHIFSHPRSGSTLLIHIIKSFGFTSFVEVFHPSDDVFCGYARSFLAENKSLEVLSLEERRTNPWKFIEDLKLVSSGGKIGDYVFKTFVGHLKLPLLFSDNNPANTFLVHERSLLHSFASDIVARKIKKWGRVDTTNMIVDFDINEFKDYFWRHYRYLSEAKAFCLDKKLFFPVTYSNLVELELAKLAELFHPLLEAYGINVSDDWLPHSSLPVKQNSSSLLSEKFSDISSLTELFADSFDLLDGEIFPSDQANLLIAGKLSRSCH